MNFKKSMVIGLTALLSGCAEKEYEIGTCKIGDLQIKEFHHEVDFEADYVSLKFYKNDKVVGDTRIGSVYGNHNWFQCDDGQVLEIRSGDPMIYFRQAEPKK